MPASFRAVAARGTAVAAAVALTAATWFGWSALPSDADRGQRTGSASARAPTPALPAGSIGSVDVPRDELISGSSVQMSGWVIDPAGIDRVELRVDDRVIRARYGVSRADVAAIHPGYPDSAHAGFEIAANLAPLSPERHQIAIVAINRAGKEATIGLRGLVPPEAMAVWQPLYSPAIRARHAPFQFLIASSGIAHGGADELPGYYRSYVSPTVGVGLRVPILYLRTTLGARHDWVFDPEWDVDRSCGSKRIADDSLASVLEYSVKHQLPVLFTLNGGIWADASCDVPDWDVNDHLEQDAANCQWNEHDQVEADDALSQIAGLPASTGAPELGRSLTFNVYAAQNRAYKRRNLQAAGRIIARFAREHPHLFAGVNLDPDTYLNPFFEEREWYDYNPGTLRQFREWLSGSGPYAGHPSAGVPNLTRYRRSHPLSLAEVSHLAGHAFTSWREVQPPRLFARGDHPYWKDPWVHEWDVFRRHLVGLHYDELAAWLREVQIPRDRIFSSQGFMAPTGDALPFAVKLTSPSKNYDSGGMSIEGSIPRDGHLGAILYGKSAVDDVRMETEDSLFATFRRMDPGWAVVEFNTADLRTPEALPTYAMAYRALRNMFNHGARFASPMAWNGSNGLYAGKPGYVSYTAWRNTPLEEAMRDFAVSHAFLPLGARLWTFGSAQHADHDGWSAASGTILEPAPGRVGLTARSHRAAMLSPGDLDLERGDADALVLQVDDVRKLAAVRVEGEGLNGTWIALSREVDFGTLDASSAGRRVPLSWPSGVKEIRRLRVAMELASDSSEVTVRHIALYPSR